MKHKIIIIAVLVVLTSAAFIFGAYHKADTVLGNASQLTRVYMSKGGGSSTFTPVATTTGGVTFLAAGATTTFPFSTDRADAISLNIQVTASTSAGTLVGTYEVSNDSKTNCDTVPTECTWSQVSVIPLFAAATNVISSTSPLFTFRPDGALNATTTVNVTLTNLAYKYVRFKFSVSGSAAALWADVSRKVQTNN